MKYGLALDIDETLSATCVARMNSLSGRFGNLENLNAQELLEKYKDMKNVLYW